MSVSRTCWVQTHALGAQCPNPSHHPSGTLVSGGDGAASLEDKTGGASDCTREDNGQLCVSMQTRAAQAHGCGGTWYQKHWLWGLSLLDICMGSPFGGLGNVHPQPSGDKALTL